MRSSNRWQLAAVLAGVVAVASCDSGGGTNPQTLGSLALQVNGLNAGTNAAITVTGPGGYSQSVTSTSTLTDLEAGPYTVAASPVTADGGRFDPAPSTQNASVTDGHQAAASVAYTLATGQVTITVTGLPSGLAAAITVTGPGGYSQTVTSTTTLDTLAPGTYQVSASAVSSSSGQFAPALATQQATVTASPTPVAVAVAYAAQVGSLALTVQGLPGGANAMVTVSGPGGFSHVATASETLSGLAPGAYTIAAAGVTAGGANYAPSPASQSVTVAANATANATVMYGAVGGNLTVTVTGLPTGANAAITVTGPGGYSHAVTATTTLTSLTPGTYTIAANTATSGLQTYVPTPASQTKAVTAGATASAAVSYAQVIGSIVVTVNGLPAGAKAAITVTGPGGYSHALTATMTLTALVLGTYTIAASPVTSGSTYSPHPASQTVTLTVAARNGAATVGYALPTAVLLALQPVGSGLSHPVYLTAPAGDTRLFVVQQGGVIKIIKNGVVSATPFLNLTGQVATGVEQGLLSMAFHPQYSSNGTFFIYLVNTSGNIEIRKGTVSSNPDVANAATELVLMIPHPINTNHNGGLLMFGLDGYLYAGVGDGGGGGDVPNNAQNTNILLGKLLRIDVNHTDPGLAYAIPPTNPFAGQAGMRGEIWAYGLRNPWRYSFDPPTGLLYLADVGENTYEEVDIQPATQGGLDYGWHIMEGFHCFNPSTGCPQAGLTLPKFEYAHSGGSCAIVGGYVYHGSQIPELDGTYFYSDFCAGFVKSFQFSGGAVTNQKDWQLSAGLVNSFGRDAQGELYIMNGAGNLYKIVRQ